MTAPSIQLRVVPGSGRLIRRAGAVLFTPQADSGDLITAFDAAPSDAEAAASVQQLLVDSGFQLPPFVIVTCDVDLHIVVFGAVEVVTSLATAPMISGAGSGTWVEHRVAGGAAQSDVTIAVNEGAHEDTDLRLGVTSAGGFVLELSNQAPTAALPPAGAPAVSPAGSVAAAALERADLEDDPTVQAPPKEAASATADPPVENRGRLVEARLCAGGHPNPLRSATCRTCGLEMTPLADGEAAHPSYISQPSLGRLVFADGSTVELNQSVVVGRKPSAGQPGDAVCAVPGDDVSRSHVRVVARDWDVFITDLDSRNGTYLRVGDDPTPTRLDPGVEQLLEAPTAVHLGSAEVAFHFEQGLRATKRAKPAPK